jgi:plastocyanin/head-tail adaptor
MRAGPVAAALPAFLAAALALASPARAELAFVSMGYDYFSPSHLDVLVGDAVSWRNGSVREHDVHSDVGGFDSGRVGTGGIFGHNFSEPGDYPYICTIHTFMTGDIAVYPLLLSGPIKPVARGAAVALDVRAPAGVGDVTIEADTGSGFRPVARAGTGRDEHAGDGTLHATVKATESATFRAAGPSGPSQEIRIEVTDNSDVSLAAASTRRGAVLRAKALPEQPGARAVLQLHLRERFGWWPVARARLDAHSRARFVVRRRARVRARVVLVGADWATQLAVSPVVVARGGRGRG